MKQLGSFALVLFLACNASAQKADTIVTMRGKIIGTVKEITPDLVSYSTPNETVVYKIEKGAIAKICFGSGRVETFSDLKSLANLDGAFDWKKVDVAMTEHETSGLYKIDLVSTKATGTTVYSSVTKVQDRATNKLKMATALLGGNLVYIKNEAIEGNIRSRNGGRTARTQIFGTAYCSQLLDDMEFKRVMDGGNEYTMASQIGLRNNDADINNISTFNEPVKIDSYRVEKGFIYLTLTIGRRKMNIDYRVINFKDNKIIVAYKEGTGYYNLLLMKR